ncbi:molybdopterin-dependent oxidoreductase [Nakamurella leprariae]|uniref:Molybdopterin-dependent oxidoreductase n=1 Tax=Nakamurella leprariae TaxID=2803911 RepID=A0A938YF89_9ACTN|nr:molybdopterin-dependent oxidoreductase [Nakamurella leprariae]MBM9467332.1 molybdopterin-dependent oxidoreductase [Nakamurella leprariae]
MTQRSAPAATAVPPPPAVRVWRPGVGVSALLGVVAVGLTLGLAELLAALGWWSGLLDPAASPVASLGAGFIELTPEWLKRFAIDTFGEHDKTALRIGMGVTLVVVAVAVGLLGRRSPRSAATVAGALTAVAVAAVVTRPSASAVDAVPTVAGGLAGIALLIGALRRTVLTRDQVTEIERTRRGVPPTGTTPEPAAGRSPDPADRAVFTGARHPMSRAGSGAAQVRPGVDRRRFLLLAGTGALVATAAGGLARWVPSGADVMASRAALALPPVVDALPVPGTPVVVDGVTPFVTPADAFYRVDTAFTVPQLTAEDWRLRVHGRVGRTVELSFADLLAMPAVERTITLTCVSNEVGGNLVGTARWQGVRLADVLALAGVGGGPGGEPDAPDCVLSTSVDGFTVTTPLDALLDGRDALLAYGMNGDPLPQEHGFPVRMVVPGLYGYVSATKWVVDLELTRFQDVSAYWTDRGWAAQAPIKTSSRIDVPRGFAQLPPGEVVVAGVAWAQHRGITAVQVQIDDGDWQDAELSDAFTVDTWRQWVFRWDARPGPHVVRCRAVDGSGVVQTADRVGTLPDGSTGLDSRQVTVTA